MQSSGLTKPSTVGRSTYFPRLVGSHLCIVVCSKNDCRVWKNQTGLSLVSRSSSRDFTLLRKVTCFSSDSFVLGSRYKILLGSIPMLLLIKEPNELSGCP